MENTDVIGGVSPLKARGKRGGRAAGAATSTSGRRGGFAKAKGKRGGGGRNVAGYNANTRFKSREWKKPASSGPSSSTAPPFSNGLPNPININNINQLSGGTDGKYMPAEYATRETETEEKKVYEGHEKACHPDRKAKHFTKDGVVDEAGFKADCDRYKKHKASPDYKPSNETVTTKGSQTYMVKPASFVAGTAGSNFATINN